MKIKIIYIQFFFTFLLFAYMWILFGWNTGNADFENYMEMFQSDYSDIKLSSMDFGYFYLNYVFSSYGFTFIEFRAILSLFGLSLLYLFIIKWSTLPFKTTLIYLFTVFFIDAVQVRNFYGYVIVLFSLHFLVNGNFRGRFWYVIFVLIASTFHFAMLFYLLFVFIDPEKKMNVKYHLLNSLILLMIGTPLLKYGYTLFSINDNGKIQNYLEVFSIPALIISVFILLLNYFILNSFINRNSDELIHVNNTSISLSNYRLENIVYNVNVLLFYLIPFFSIDMTFLRLYRNFFILNIVYILQTTIYKNKLSIKYKFLLYLYIILAFLGFVWLYKDTTLFAVLKNNSLISN